MQKIRAALYYNSIKDMQINLKWADIILLRAGWEAMSSNTVRPVL